MNHASPQQQDIWWHKLKSEIIDPGLETQCGTSVGVSNGTLCYKEVRGVPVLCRTEKPEPVPQAAFDACPARYCNYPELNEFVFGSQPENMLSGVVQKAYIGYAADDAIRKSGASGGVLSALQIYLLEEGLTSETIALCMGAEVPWRAKPIVARSKEDVLRCAQSVYSVTPTNTILSELSSETSSLSYIGLPDQVAGIRKLQKMQHPSVKNIQYIFGPYMGTQMYFEAVRSFLRSHGVSSEEEIVDLQYRAGEWPGHLQISLKNGRVLKAHKFHYNYLIPFFITKSSLQLVDFTNELTDISVGDAWSPVFEQKSQGFSVVLARSDKGVDLLTEMQQKGLLHLEEIPLDQALDMHGHMIDFKKRGSFIRNRWKRVQPDYGYHPVGIPFSRVVVEVCLAVLFAVGRNRCARFFVEHLPQSIVGPTFNTLRKSWKAISKPTKRKGLRNTKFVVHEK